MRELSVLAVLILACAGCGEGSGSDPMEVPSGGAGDRNTGGGGHGASAGSSGDGSGGTAEAPSTLIEPDPDEVCLPDPERDRWSITSLGPGDYRSVAIGVGGDLAVLVYGLAEGGVYARSTGADNEWSEPTQLSGANVSGIGTKVGVSADGSAALLLWTEAGNVRASVYTTAAGFGEASTLEAVPQALDYDVDLAMLSEGRALLAWGSSSGITTLEYAPSRGFYSGASVFTNFERMSLGANDKPVAFGSSSLIAEGASRYEYTFGEDFGAGETIPLQLAAAAWQDFFFEFPNGRAARVVKTWLDDATAGLHVTTRAAGQWSSEERVTPFGAFDTSIPHVSYAGSELLLFWENEERVALRAHDTAGWGSEESLPRSRALQIDAVAGSGTGSALLIGQQVIVAEDVGLTKLYRRGEDRTWYCAELYPYGPTLRMAGSDGQYAVAFWSNSDLRVARFQP